jgi:Leucine-rich repeat (LRR) protein
MKMKGWVYIISNKATPDVIKVGYSTNDPIGRAKAFGTGSPYQYQVEYEILVNNPRQIEKLAHNVLLPVNEGKEWFRCDIKKAVSAIKEVVGEEFIFERNFNQEKLESENSLWVNELVLWYNSVETKNLATTKLPSDFERLKQLKTLSLSFCKLNHVPNSIGNLSNLKSLELMSNEICILPDSIGELKSLERLVIGDNQLVSLPESFCEMKSLNVLFMQRNKISQLPESIGGLKNLTYMFIPMNEIRFLPESIGGLEKLEQLILIGNKLTDLPKSFENLSSLKELHLSYNDFSDVPDCLFELENLEVLSLNYNRIEKSKIPKRKNFKNIKSLTFAGQRL